jgi:toxin YoeB
MVDRGVEKGSLCMVKYNLILSPEAKADILALRKAGDKVVLRKIENLFKELEEHPYFGTGKPEPLKYKRPGVYSRRINRKHRLVYSIQEEVITVLVLDAYGHYEDK